MSEEDSEAIDNQELPGDTTTEEPQTNNDVEVEDSDDEAEPKPEPVKEPESESEPEPVEKKVVKKAKV